MSEHLLKWGLSGAVLNAFIQKLDDDELVPIPEALHSVIVEIDEPGGDVVGWEVTDIEGNEVDDYFMSTAFGSLLAGECLMAGISVKDEQESYFKP
jgi:hypothetical protein